MNLLQFGEISTCRFSNFNCPTGSYNFVVLITPNYKIDYVITYTTLRYSTTCNTFVSHCVAASLSFLCEEKDVLPTKAFLFAD